MKFKTPLFFLVFLLLLIPNVPSVYATTETRYMTSEYIDWAGNGYKLKTSQTSTILTHLFSLYDGSVYVTQYIGIRVYLNHSDKTLTEITSGVVAIASGNISGLISQTWSCPQTTMDAGDRVQIKVYASDFSPPTAFMEKFETEVLSTTLLNSNTWTVYYHLLRTYTGGGVRLTKYYFGWGSSTYNSRIEGFKYGESAGTTINVYGAIAQKITINHLNAWTFSLQSGITQTFTITSAKTIQFTLTSTINQTFTTQVQITIARFFSFYGSIAQTILTTSQRAWQFTRSAIINPTFTISTTTSGLGTILNLFGTIAQNFIIQALTIIPTMKNELPVLFACLILAGLVTCLIVWRRKKLQKQS